MVMSVVVLGNKHTYDNVYGKWDNNYAYCYAYGHGYDDSCSYIFGHVRGHICTYGKIEFKLIAMSIRKHTITIKLFSFFLFCVSFLYSAPPFHVNHISVIFPYVSPLCNSYPTWYLVKTVN